MIFISDVLQRYCKTLYERGYWKTRNNVRTEYRNNGITFNENALNIADMARAVGVQRGSSATVENYEHWIDSQQLPYSQK